MSWKEELNNIDDGSGDCLKRFAFAMVELFDTAIHEWNASELYPESCDNAKVLINKAIQEAWDKSNAP